MAVQFRTRANIFSSEVKKCSKTKHSNAKTVTVNSLLQQASKNSMQKRVSRMSPNVAKNVAMHAKTVPVANAKCSLQSALNAARKQEFLSSPEKTVLYFAANALQSQRKMHKLLIS